MRKFMKVFYEYPTQALTFLFYLALLASLLAGTVGAWLTHTVLMIGRMFESPGAGEIVVFLVGFVFFPIGIIHGWMIWFGAGVGV